MVGFVKDNLKLLALPPLGPLSHFRTGLSILLINDWRPTVHADALPRVRQPSLQAYCGYMASIRFRLPGLAEISPVGTNLELSSSCGKSSASYLLFGNKLLPGHSYADLFSLYFRETIGVCFPILGDQMVETLISFLQSFLDIGISTSGRRCLSYATAPIL